MRFRLVISVSVSVATVACGSEAPDATPTGAVLAFVEAARHATDEVGARNRMVGLLDASTRRHLERRAREASALSAGREFGPWEMIARDGIRVALDSATAQCTERVTDGRAVVSCRSPEDDKTYDFDVVREAEGWRVAVGVDP